MGENAFPLFSCASLLGPLDQKAIAINSHDHTLYRFEWESAVTHQVLHKINGMTRLGLLNLGCPDFQFRNVDF